MIFVLQINNIFLTDQKMQLWKKGIGKIVSCNNTKHNKWKNVIVPWGDISDL